MALSKLQRIGIFLGCLPGSNVVAGLIKFFVYFRREGKAHKKEKKRTSLQETASKTAQLTPKIDIPPSSLKWYGLLQMIPIIGIYGAMKEKRVLERISSVVLKTSVPEAEEKKMAPPPPTPAPAPKSPVAQTEEVDQEGSKPEPLQLIGTVLSVTEEQKLNQEERKEITKEISKKGFNNHLLSHWQLSLTNKALLSSTLCTVPQLPKKIAYYNVTGSPENLQKIRSAPAQPHGKPVVTLEPQWFDYKEPHHFYIDFAHATSLGGAYRSYGCVQEERMFAEFAELACLDFVTQNGVHPCVDADGKSHHTYPPQARPYPFIVEGIQRDFDITNVPYGTEFRNSNEEQIKAGIRKAENPVPVNIIGLAAMDWRNIPNPKYKLEHLIYHFDAAYLANKGAQNIAERSGKKATIHTAPWGCGEFKNGIKMMTAIQYLAARAAGVDLVFHGVRNPMNPGYSETTINEIIREIEEYLDKGQPPQQILETLLSKQEGEGWGPRT